MLRVYRILSLALVVAVALAFGTSAFAGETCKPADCVKVCESVSKADCKDAKSCAEACKKACEDAGKGKCDAECLKKCAEACKSGGKAKCTTADKAKCESKCSNVSKTSAKSSSGKCGSRATAKSGSCCSSGTAKASTAKKTKGST